MASAMVDAIAVDRTSNDLTPHLDPALAAAERLKDAAAAALRPVVSRDGRIDAALLEREQHAAHGLAWFEVYVEGPGRWLAWSRRLDGLAASASEELMRTGHSPNIWHGSKAACR
ncbi:MAG: hypothetical protein R3C97_02130 [Geminicoccaceae bacterium]